MRPAFDRRVDPCWHHISCLTSLWLQVINDELGAPWYEIYADLTPEPIAAASLGQVYRGRLKTGEEVAVKVQRPGVLVGAGWAISLNENAVPASGQKAAATNSHACMHKLEAACACHHKDVSTAYTVCMVLLFPGMQEPCAVSCKYLAWF